MKKVNVFIPKRDRNERVAPCLHYLNLANRDRRYDVEVFVVDDAHHELDLEPFQNVRVNHVVQPFPQDEGFRRGALLNRAFLTARKDFDWFSMVDLDMVYHPDFYDIVNRHIDGPSYVICEGTGLDDESTREVLDVLPDFTEIEELGRQEFVSHSQISCSREWYQLYRDITGTDNLFSDEFCGWGHEDSALESLSSDMFKIGLSNKVIVTGVWFHLAHEVSIDRMLENRNLSLLHRILQENSAKMAVYVRRQGPSSDSLQILDQAMRVHRQGQLDRAEKLYRQLLNEEPDHAEGLHMLGVLYSQQGDHDLAVDHIRRALEIDGTNAGFHNNLGEAYRAQGRLDQAIASYQRALEIQPFMAEAHYNLANAFKQQGQLDRAVAHYQQTLRLNPEHVNAHYNLGNALLEHGQLDDAIAAYQHAVRLQPAFASAHHNMGTALMRQNRPAEAVTSYLRAVEARPDFAQAHLSLAKALHSHGQLGDPIPHYQQAARLNQNDVDLHQTIGNLLMERGRLEEAAASYRRVLELEPDRAKIHNRLGVVLVQMKQLDDATQHYERAVEIDPDLADAHYNLLLSYESQGKLDQAREAYHRLAELEPIDPLLQFHMETLCPPVPASNAEIDHYRVNLERTLERYRGFDLSIELERLHLSGAHPPLVLAYQGRDELGIKTRWAAVFDGRLPVDEPSIGDGKPHIGIVVTQGHELTFIRGMQRIVNNLPQNRFRLTVVCGGEYGERRIRPAITNAAVEYLPVPARLDQAARAIREARFDVVYYREVGTDATNYFLPFLRLAPIQCVSWGTSYTTGIPQVDYYLSCEQLETEDADSHYTESLVRLEGMPTLDRPQLPETIRPRQDFGLRDSQHVYLCAQNLLKVHPDFDPLAAEILRRDPDGVLVFLGTKHPYISTLLKRRFERTLPDVVDRVLFLPRVSKPDYMSVMALAEVSLDTLHFCGSNCTNDAFVAGTPVVTLPGRYQRGRYTSGAYRTMGLTECIAESPAEYIEIALRLGTDPAYRTRVSAEIAATREALFEDMATVHSVADFFEEAIAKARAP